jgi:hypothetical protein
LPSSSAKSLFKNPGRNACLIAFVVGSAIVVVSVIQSLNYATVLLLLGLVVLEGFLIMLFVLLGGDLLSHSIVKQRNNDDSLAPASSKDIVATLKTYVNNAASGSDFSRREIARILRNVIIQRFGSFIPDRESRIGNRSFASLTLDEHFKRDIESVVSSYVADPWIFKDEDNEPDSILDSSDRSKEISPSDIGGASAVGRVKYLSTLKRIISKLS